MILRDGVRSCDGEQSIQSSLVNGCLDNKHLFDSNTHLSKLKKYINQKNIDLGSIFVIWFESSCLITMRGAVRYDPVAGVIYF